MAIDSAKKRKSALAVGLLVAGPVVVPDGTIDAADRQAIAYSYNGFTAAEVATATFVCVESVTLSRPTATVTLTECS